MIEAKPENLIGDTYDGDLLDEEWRNHGIEMIAPPRYNELMTSL